MNQISRHPTFRNEILSGGYGGRFLLAAGLDSSRSHGHPVSSSLARPLCSIPTLTWWPLSSPRTSRRTDISSAKSLRSFSPSSPTALLAFGPSCNPTAGLPNLTSGCRTLYCYRVERYETPVLWHLLFTGESACLFDRSGVAKDLFALTPQRAKNVLQWRQKGFSIVDMPT